MNFIDITNVVAEHFSGLAQANEVASTLNDVATAAADTTQADGLKALGQGIGAGLAMVGSIGVGLGEGITVAAAATAVGRNPEAQPKIMNIMIVGMAITESVAIYALIVSILLIFVM